MIFSVKNCKITVSFLFFAVLALFLMEDRSGSALPVFSAAALHESGHLGALRCFGAGLSEIRFTPFGIDMVKSGGTKRSYGKDALISLAGPAANLAAVPLCLAFPCGTAQKFLLANCVFAGFNLLPVEPLDGGQALYSLLCMKLPENRAAGVVSVISFAVLTPLAALGFVALFRSPWNISLLVVSGYLMLLLLLKRERYD